MASKGENTSSSVQPTSARVSATGSDKGSAADIHAFLGGMPRKSSSSSQIAVSLPLIEHPEHTKVFPQSPWTVSSGYYTRPDGSVVYIEHPHQIRNTGLNRSASSSMEVLTGGNNGASAQHGAKNGQ